MNGFAARTLCALALSGIAGIANASPIYFNFTGTVTETTGSYASSVLPGSSVSGGFLFDTAKLTPMFSPDLAMTQFFEYPMSSSQAFLMSGAGEVDAPVFEQESSANIRFADTDCYWLVICNPVEPYREGFALSAISRDVAVSTMYQPGYVGQVHESNLEVSSWNYGATDFAAFDWTTAAPMDIVTRALNETSGVYYDTLYTCTGESFCQSEIVGAFRFDVTSVTRGSDTHDVPEPGTIGLFAFGLAGLWLVRRRVLPAGGAAARGA